MTRRPSIIVDIDGTVSDSRHRLHHVLGVPKNRDAFHAEFHKDPPIQAVVDLVNSLAYDNNIILVTGRPDRHRDGTQDQMDEFGLSYDELFMRPEGDNRCNAEYKRGVLGVLQARGHEVRLAIDDLHSAVDMWRENGIHCLHTQAV